MLEKKPPLLNVQGFLINALDSVADANAQGAFIERTGLFDSKVHGVKDQVNASNLTQQL